MWTISDILKVTSANLVGACDQDEKYILNFDSRLNKENSIFLALKGDQFDAHNFLAQAYQNGACGFIVHQLPNQETKDLLISLSKTLEKSEAFFICVKDTLVALHELASFYRKKLTAKVLGVAGSNGKTTTKEFLATICKENGKTHYSAGSFNNHWGVPFTILSCPQDANYLILEMGMNHAGELGQLTILAQPDISVLTMIGVEHIEHFGSLEKIAEAEEEIFKYSSSSSVLIINRDNIYTNKISKKYSNKNYSFSSVDASADIYFRPQEGLQGSLSFEATISEQSHFFHLNLFGQHNLTNLMAAAAVAMAAKIPVQKIFSGLQKCKGYWGRNQWVKSEKGFDILFDGYNSSPESLAALVDNVKRLKLNSNLFAVIGQMKELGDHSKNFHIEAGKKLAELNFKKIWFIGEDADHLKQGYIEKLASMTTTLELNEDSVVVSKDFEPRLAIELAHQASATDLVLVKGSRGVFLERFVKFCWPIGFSDKA